MRKILILFCGLALLGGLTACRTLPSGKLACKSAGQSSLRCTWKAKDGSTTTPLGSTVQKPADTTTKEPPPAATTPPAKSPTTQQKPATHTPSSPPPKDTSSQPAPAAGQVCTNPSTVFHGQGSQGLGDYYADADIWNDNGGIDQAMGVCSHSSWYVDVTAADHQDGAVLSYPNVHMDYHNWSSGDEPKLSQFGSIPTTFAHRAPSTGNWNVAYDVWLNGVADNGSTELMIWTQYHGSQDPSYVSNKIATVNVDGHQWNLFASSDHQYIVYQAPKGAQLTSGSLDLKKFTDDLVSRGLLAAGSTLGQLDYGVEIVSTGGKKLHFDFTDFSTAQQSTR